MRLLQRQNGTLHHEFGELMERTTSFSHLEGVCTATIEALLMHKKVILIDADCNDIFKKYRNTYFFTTKEEFKRVLRQAIADPCIPRDPLLDDFKWENCNKVLYNEIHNILSLQRNQIP